MGSFSKQVLIPVSDTGVPIVGMGVCVSVISALKSSVRNTSRAAVNEFIATEGDL